MANSYNFSAAVQCDGKHPHQSRGTALQEIRHKREHNLEPYRCLHCGSWHVGHKPKTMKRKDKYE